MSWISYAQNAEDVRLRRAFAGQPTGFYLDVGANDPVGFSLTKHFYEAGWTGINVEPLATQFAKIVADRPRDINLNLACSNHFGELKLYAGKGGASGMSTFTEAEVAEHRRNGFDFETVTCRVVTLASVCDEHARDRVIDFMSVDVEGHELEVLEGADFGRFRPRVLIVEATRPNTQEPSHQRWEPLLLANGYVFAVFDGLNRFYVRREDEGLVERLALAPNWFDDYVPWVYQAQIDKLKARVAEAGVRRRVARRLRGISEIATRVGGWVRAQRDR